MKLIRIAVLITVKIRKGYLKKPMRTLAVPCAHLIRRYNQLVIIVYYLGPKS